MLTNVQAINQKEFKEITRLAIRSGHNVFIVGPSGGGKTLITKEAAEEEKCKMVYINLSVLERTDFQGFPVVSEDRSLVSYATPEFMPIADNSTRGERNAISSLMNILNKDDSNDHSLIKYIDNRLEDLNKQDRARIIMNAASYLSKAPSNIMDRFQQLLVGAKSSYKNDPLVILFDEVDKAATETAQPLLEVLQFLSINGRQLNVRACILTGNLPDEHAHVSQVSHAITKRCMSYKLELNFNQWREWAFKHNVHDNVIQFLSSKPEWLYKPAPDGDATAYALPSPRTWTDLSRVLTFMDSDPKSVNMDSDKLSQLQHNVSCGYVGSGAAIEFQNWYKHYRKFDPAINDLVENGTFPNMSKMTAQEILIFAIAACSRVYTYINGNKTKNKKKLEIVVKNVYKWIDTLVDDVKMASIRLSFGGDFDSVYKMELAKVPEFVKVFKDLNDKCQGWDKL